VIRKELISGTIALRGDRDAPKYDQTLSILESATRSWDTTIIIVLLMGL
jgi:hypothetical protein